MASQIICFEKNRADFSNPDATATASEAADIARYVLNRSNSTGWMTSGSADANETTLTVDLGDIRSVTDILFVDHNFKAFETLWSDDGVAWHDFSPAINELNNAASTSRFVVNEELVRYFRTTIHATQVANADKRLAQFIATKMIGQFQGWPIIKNPLHSRNKTSVKMLSGKLSVSENVGGFSCELTVSILSNDADLSLFESLFARNEGFLLWLCGGDETQFSSVRLGYRKKDIYLVKCVNDWEPEFADGIYSCGVQVKAKLAEVVD